MGAVPQHFHGLQVSVDQGVFVSFQVYDHDIAAGLDYAAHFFDGGIQIEPVVGAVAGGRDTEMPVAERQRFGAGPGRGDIFKSAPGRGFRNGCQHRSEEHTSELQSLMRSSYAVFCLKKKKKKTLSLK